MIDYCDAWMGAMFPEETALAWYFGVRVYATKYQPGRFEGGWTHDGPYKTREECEACRARILAMNDPTWLSRYEPGECFQDDWRKAEKAKQDELRVALWGRR